MPKKPLAPPTPGLEHALELVRKAYGEGSVFRGTGDRFANVEVTSTGILPLDIALGVGGFPKGRIIEVYGPESSGKTTLALHAVAESQAQGNTCAFIDAEHALDPVYAAALGVQMDELLISQPDTGEQALEILDILVRSGEVSTIVIDSVAALVPQAEIEGQMGDSHVGLQARLMSQALRKITGNVSKTGTTVIFINQIREKVGVVYGSPEVQPGGRALKFYASVRLDVRRIETRKDGTESVANRTKVTVKKNKVAPPFTITEFDITFGKGVVREDCLIDLGAELGIVKKSGAWYSYGGDNLGQGKAASSEALREDSEKADEIEKLIRAAHNGGVLD